MSRFWDFENFVKSGQTDIPWGHSFNFIQKQLQSLSFKKVVTDAPLKQTFFNNTSSKQEQQGFIDLREYKNFFDLL